MPCIHVALLPKFIDTGPVRLENDLQTAKWPPCPWLGFIEISNKQNSALALMWKETFIDFLLPPEAVEVVLLQKPENLKKLASSRLLVVKVELWLKKSYMLNHFIVIRQSEKPAEYNGFTYIHPIGGQLLLMVPRFLNSSALYIWRWAIN